MGGWWWLRRWNPFRWGGKRILGVGLWFVLWLGILTAQAAGNALPHPAGRLDDQVLGVDVNQFKPPECASIPITRLVVATNGRATGTDENELILGTDGVDRLDGGGGDDCIMGGGGDDGFVFFFFIIPYLRGGPGNDVILGGPGDDVVAGNDGRDRVYGQSGDDFLFGGSTFFGDGEPDYLDGGSGTDYCDGGGGGDTLVNCEGP